jgi:hypothetical protein
MALLDWLLRGKASRDEARRTEQAAVLIRMRNPQWDVVEAALGHPVPSVLRDLYSDHELVMSDDLLIFDPSRGDDPNTAWNVNQFNPADAEALTPALESIPRGSFSFATNEFGDPFYVQLGELPDGDGQVFVHYHDGGDIELVAPSLRSFLTWRREPRIDRARAI